MSLMRKMLARFFSGDQVLFEGDGLYATVKVIKNGNRINLYTGRGFLQSSISRQEVLKGTHSDWFLAAPWFSGNFEGTLDSLLILGLGAGSEVPLYNRVYKVKTMTGVEVDPLILDLGKRYFGLDVPNLKIITGDARLFLDTTEDTYNQIILDPFKEDIFEESCQSFPFLNKICSHLTSEGVLFINRVLDDSSNGEAAGKLKKLFNTVVTLRIRNNIFFVATNSLRAPKSSVEVQRLLLEVSESNPSLKFFRSSKLRDIRVF